MSFDAAGACSAPMHKTLAVLVLSTEQASLKEISTACLEHPSMVKQGFGMK